MEILRTISLYTDGKDMPFLLIGGHAVGVYGISRQTGDIDLLVQREKKSDWLTLMGKLNYSVDQNDENFARFKPDNIAAWPIDFMFVESATFQKLLSDSRQFDVGVAKVRVAAPLHIAMLKMHALKMYQEHRFVKDYNDLLQLLRLHGKHVSQDELRSLCLRYADLKLFERLQKDLHGA